nr:hypothetical protein [Cellulosilyticum ruminicola]
MKLLTYKYKNKECVGVLSADEKVVCPIDAIDLSYATMNELIENITLLERKKLVALSEKMKVLF